MVEFDGVVKKFGNVTALERVSFGVTRGEIVSLLGPSGCGKTTSLRLLAGFESPDAGRVLVSGHNVAGKRPYERNVGLLFQDYALFPHLTVEQNIAYGLKYRGFPRVGIPGQVSEMLQLVKLSGYENRLPDKLSGGQQQRVALARSLATKPEVMLLDEPLSALDAKLREELRAELKDILVSVGSTTILVTHDQQEAMSLSHRIVLMDRGQVVQIAPPSVLYNEPVNRFAAEFLGRSNWFEGTLMGSSDSTHCVLRSTEGLLLTVPATAETGSRARYDVCLRRERIVLRTPGNVAEADLYGRMNCLEGVIDDVFELGAELEVHLRLPMGSSVVALEKYAGQPIWKAGEPVVATFFAKDCILLPSA